MKKDLTQKRFGRLVALSTDGNRWLCRCDCGQTKVAGHKTLLAGNTRSCGCLRRETCAAQGRSSRESDMKGTRPWRIWTGMKSRCNNPNNKDYPRYGGAGIKVSPNWASFAGFWVDMSKGYSDELQLDRIKGTLGYSKSNCRWATVRQQQRNRKSNCYISTPKGRMTVVEAAETFGLPWGCLKMRVEAWPAHRWFEPKRPHVRK